MSFTILQSHREITENGLQLTRKKNHVWIFPDFSFKINVSYTCEPSDWFSPQAGGLNPKLPHTER